jgi:predicted nucleic acid-binding Zn ribbon protein
MHSVKDLIPAALRKLESPEALVRRKLMAEWPGIAGARIAPHTRPSLGKKADLWVWVDRSALAYELNQKFRQTILKRAQAALGEETVKEIRFRVGQIR